MHRQYSYFNRCVVIVMNWTIEGVYFNDRMQFSPAFWIFATLDASFQQFIMTFSAVTSEYMLYNLNDVDELVPE